MMMRKTLLLGAALAAAATFLSCQKPAEGQAPKKAEAETAAAPAVAPEVEAAILDAVRTYLANKVDVGNMDIHLIKAAVDGDKAVVTAAFGVKGKEGTVMAYTYDLARENGQWAVISGRSEGAPHAGQPGAEGGMPPGHPGMGGDAHGMAPSPHGGSDLPPGHPPVATGTESKPHDSGT